MFIYSHRIKFIFAAAVSLSALVFLISCLAHADEDKTTQSKQKPGKYSLAECYNLALKQNEILQQQQASVREAEALYKEAISMILPKVYSFTQQRFRNSENFGRIANQGDVSVPGNNLAAQSDRPFDSTINVRQPLFTGFREGYLVDAQKANVKALSFDRERQTQLLYQDLADVFNQVVYYEKDLDILKRTSGVLRTRIAELQEFIDLGKARLSEKHAAESEYAQNEALSEQVRGLYFASKELLAFLTGVSAEKLTVDWNGENRAFVKLESLIENANARYDIKAADQRIKQTQNELVAAQRESWPRLSFDGSYYTYEDPDLTRDWDMLFRLEIPLFVGGEIDARIDQVKERKNIAALEKQRISRLAEQEVRTAYNNFMITKDEIKQLQDAVAAAKRNLQSQKKDYQLGVVTNLEVLSAISVYQNTQRRLLDAEARQKTNVARLLVASGEI